MRSLLLTLLLIALGCFAFGQSSDNSATTDAHAATSSQLDDQHPAVAKRLDLDLSRQSDRAVAEHHLWKGRSRSVADAAGWDEAIAAANAVVEQA